MFSEKKTAKRTKISTPTLYRNTRTLYMNCIWNSIQYFAIFAQTEMLLIKNVLPIKCYCSKTYHSPIKLDYKDIVKKHNIHIIP